MPVRSPLLLAVFATLAIAVPAAAAPPVTVTPDSIEVAGKVGTAYAVTSDYDAFGLWFGDGVETRLFFDGAAKPSNSWIGALPDAGYLESPVQARLVVPGTGGAAAATTAVTVEAGDSAPGALVLEGFDCSGKSVGVVASNTALGPHGRTIWTLTAPAISAIRVRPTTTPGDSFVVTQIDLGETTPYLAADIAVSEDSSGMAGSSQTI